MPTCTFFIISASQEASHRLVDYIPFKLHKFMLSLDPTLGSMQFLGHLKFLEYIMIRGETIKYSSFKKKQKNEQEINLDREIKEYITLLNNKKRKNGRNQEN